MGGLLKQMLRTRTAPIFDIAMTISAKRNEVAQLICRLPIAVKRHVRDNVVNVNPSLLASIFVCLTAYLALATIALKRQLALFSPVSPAIMLLTALPAGMSCAAHRLRHESVLTGATTKTAMPLLCENLVARVRFAALCAVLRYKILRPTRCNLRLSCAELGTALRRTKAPWATVPSNKGFAAMLASAFLLRVNAMPSFMFCSTLRRAIFLYGSLWREGLTAFRTGFIFSEESPCNFGAFLGAVFMFFEVGRRKVVTVVFTADRAGFHSVFLSLSFMMSLAGGETVHSSGATLANIHIIPQRAV
jgi:hypothetical protein